MTGHDNKSIGGSRYQTLRTWKTRPCLPFEGQIKGVLRRAGHTEAVVDLTRFAGLKPGGALVEIMNDDGTMSRLKDLIKIREKFGIKIISIQDLIKYKLKKESIIEKGVKVKLPTEWGEFDFIPFRQKSSGLEHCALIKGKWKKDEPVLVRVHSSCFTGDIFGSMRCDCGQQLHKAMEIVEKEGKGVIIYLNQEGRASAFQQDQGLPAPRKWSGHLSGQ